MRRRWRELAALHARHDLGEPGMAWRRHADLGALARDVAVHGIDLGAPALKDVLRHRRALDVAARVGAGLRHDDGLDLRERGGVALGGARDALGIGTPDLLEPVAERLADAHRFAGEPDLEAADLVVAQAVARGQPGRRSNAVAHAVLNEFRPALAPQVGRRLRAVDAAEPLDQLLDARRDAPVRLADAEDGVLIAALRDGPADAAGLVQVHRDHRGDHADGASPPDYAGDGFLVEAVLQRNDEAFRGQIWPDQGGRPQRVVGLDRDERDIDRPPGERLDFGQVQGLGALHREPLLGRHAVELQTARPDGFDMLRPRVDQRHVVPEVRERAADI